MRIVKDYAGRDVRITDERVRHFVKRLTKAGMFEFVEDALANPDFVIESASDSKANLSYRFYRGTRVGDKYLCVVVKYDGDDAYVLTAYPSDQVKKGRLIWERRKK